MFHILTLIKFRAKKAVKHTQFLRKFSRLSVLNLKMENA
nr:MAG TPA: hypothetical protein [Caudoviricetes sp.]